MVKNGKWYVSIHIKRKKKNKKEIKYTFTYLLTRSPSEMGCCDVSMGPSYWTEQDRPRNTNKKIDFYISQLILVPES